MRVEVGETFEFVLAATCRSLGTVTVTVETVGVTPDRDGYVVSAVVPGFRADTATAIRDTYRVRVIEGAHLVTLGDVAANCDVAGANSVDIEVASGGSAAASFSVECGPLTRLAYVRFAREIHTIASNATDEFRLSGGVTSDQNPTWSPDGRRIAFSSSVGGMRDIWVMDADGSNRVPLTHHGARDYKPTWSPYGRRIAFVSERDGNPELYIMDADGSRETRLTTHEATDIDSSWSPDGLSIAFSSNRGDFAPAWSPSGDLIAFQRFERDCEDPVSCPSSIRVISAAGSSAIYVTAGRQPAWSPDGRKIARATTVMTRPTCTTCTDARTPASGSSGGMGEAMSPPWTSRRSCRRGGGDRQARPPDAGVCLAIVACSENPAGVTSLRAAIDSA
jgi:TolB protein